MTDSRPTEDFKEVADRHLASRDGRRVEIEARSVQADSDLVVDEALKAVSRAHDGES